MGHRSQSCRINDECSSETISASCSMSCLNHWLVGHSLGTVNFWISRRLLANVAIVIGGQKQHALPSCMPATWEINQKLPSCRHASLHPFTSKNQSQVAGMQLGSKIERLPSCRHATLQKCCFGMVWGGFVFMLEYLHNKCNRSLGICFVSVDVYLFIALLLSHCCVWLWVAIAFVWCNPTWFVFVLCGIHSVCCTTGVVSCAVSFVFCSCMFVWSTPNRCDIPSVIVSCWIVVTFHICLVGYVV